MAELTAHKAKRRQLKSDEIRISQIQVITTTVVNSLWTREQVAAFFQVSVNRVKKWTDAGIIKSVHTPGGHPRYHQYEIDRFVTESFSK
jgi:phage terminase Nu1 subunit (DNA packaging protein)